MEQLIKFLLGDLGFKALEPLLKKDSLSGYILPRAIIGYLELNKTGGVDLNLFDSLNKTEQGYSGTIKLNDLDYKFENVNKTQVAAMVTLALDTQPVSDIKALDLAKLSKTIDLLLKSNNNFEDKGLVAPKHEPVKPIQVAPKTTVAGIRRRAINKTLAISNKESKTLCKFCGLSQFSKGEFVGCTCLKGLAKSIECTTKNDGFVLKFDDVDLMITVAESLGR